MDHQWRIERLRKNATAPRAGAMRWRFKGESSPGYYPTLRGRIVGGNKLPTKPEAISAARLFRKQCKEKLIELGYNAKYTSKLTYSTILS